MGGSSGIVEVSDLTKVYSMGQIKYPALKGINLRIDKGEFTSIMGPSGSGKSTLMNILGCLDRISSGKYLLSGRNISTLKEYELAFIRNREIGFVFQSFNLVSGLSVIENVELPMMYAGVQPRERRKRALEIIENVGLADRFDHRPNEISGGQKQRAAIARAIVNHPSIVLADEPTGNLDTESSIDIMKIFQKLNNDGVTIIMVTHEPDIALYTKRVIRIKDGSIVSDQHIFDTKQRH